MQMEPEAIEPETSAQEQCAEPAHAAAAGALEDEILGLRAEIADLKDRLLRAVAETENSRKRAERERQETARYAIVGFARDLIAVADNLGRALQAVPEEARENEAFRTLITGVELTERELLAAFERHGVRKIVPKGEPFNAHYHQAVAEIAAPGALPGSVVEIIQPGYAIAERLIRAAVVVVAKGQPSEAAPGSQLDTSA
jgi:molecular chaperone GrpE